MDDRDDQRGDAEPTMSRRSTRQRSHQEASAQRKGGLLPALSKYWRQQYIDMGHCRLKRCRERLLHATAGQMHDLADSAPGFSFTAMAIAASSAYGSSRESELLSYVQAVVARGLHANDAHQRNPSVVLAAYHGYHRVLRALLDEGCHLDGVGEYGHAVLAAVRNGQHESLEIVLQARPAAGPSATALLASCRRACNSVLFLAIERRDVASLGLLRDAGVRLSDYDLVCLNLKRFERSRFEPMLQALHPGSASVVRWSKELHWSFPATDRAVMNLIWHTLRRVDLLPDVLWLLVLSFVERGWWASRQQRPPAAARLESVTVAPVVAVVDGVVGDPPQLEWSHQLCR